MLWILTSKDTYPTKAENAGILSLATWISSNPFVLFNDFFDLLLQQVQPQGWTFLLPFFFPPNLGDWKIFDYSGTSWLSAGGLAARISQVRCSFFVCIMVRRTPALGSSSHSPWRTMWQAAVGGIYMEMARLLATAQGGLCSFKQLGLLRGKTQPEQKVNRESVKGVGESDRRS